MIEIIEELTLVLGGRYAGVKSACVAFLLMGITKLKLGAEFSSLNVMIAVMLYAALYWGVVLLLEYAAQKLRRNQKKKY